jgi:uncharacterized transporter YbjL
LAHDDLMVELGDRIRVCVPRSQLEAVNQQLGHSERQVSQIDALSLGIGLTLGLLLRLLTIPLPGGIKPSGAAAGPLLVGMAPGRIERTGPHSPGFAEFGQPDDPSARTAAVPGHHEAGLGSGLRLTDLQP